MQLELPRRRRGGMTLTALVDVVFILLFFFMLAARPATPRALDLQLAASGAAASGDTARAVVVGSDRVRYAGRELSAAVLAQQLRAEQRQVLLQADPAAKLGDLTAVLDALRGAGVPVQLSAETP